jgi:hypothetical protein
MGCLATTALAETEPERVLIDFDAPGECGDRETFLQRVRERTDRFSMAEPDGSVRRFSIQITDLKERFAGVLTIESPSAARQQRDIASNSCSDVVDALAFFTALAIDPQLSSGGDEPEPDTETPPAEPLPALPIPPTEPLPPRREDERSWRFGAGAHFVVLSGVAPELLLGGEALLDFTLFPGKVLSPAFRGGVRIVRNAEVEADIATSHFELATAWLEVCPLWIGAAEIGIRLCAGGELGRLTAEGFITRPEEVNRDWAALSGTLRPTVVLVDRILLEAGVGALFPLRRDSFSFAGRVPFHEVETVTFLLTAGVTGWVF